MLFQVLGDRYEVQQKLSKKPGRQTFLALDRNTQKLVIIKLLIFSYDFEWDDLKQFEREAQILQTLDHPAIPKYLDSFELDLPHFKGYALVQTYIEAKSLEAHLQARRTFSNAEIKQIAQSILEVLIYLHQRNPPVIHRDLKPSNILLANRSGHSAGQVYLVDFGSVQNSIAVESGTFTVAGTYGYAPIEQFSGRAHPASDLYSLGMTLIYLITGQHPADLQQQDMKIQFEQGIKLKPSFSRWLRKMTEPNLERRYSSSREALQVLKHPQLQDRALPSGRPKGSEILLTKSADELQIILPSKLGKYCPGIFEFAKKKSFRKRLLSLLLVLPAMVFGFISYCFFLMFIILPFAAFCMALGVSGFYAILITTLFVLPTASWIVVYYSLSKSRLKIDRQQIYLTRKFLGVETNVFYPPCSRNDIVRLEKVNPYRRETTDYKVSSFDDSPQLIIWANNQYYILENLNILEANWLANELSDWLEIPIKYRKSPIIPYPKGDPAL